MHLFTLAYLIFSRVCSCAACSVALVSVMTWFSLALVPELMFYLYCLASVGSTSISALNYCFHILTTKCHTFLLLPGNNFLVNVHLPLAVPIIPLFSSCVGSFSYWALVISSLWEGCLPCKDLPSLGAESPFLLKRLLASPLKVCFWRTQNCHLYLRPSTPKTCLCGYQCVVMWQQFILCSRFYQIWFTFPLLVYSVLLFRDFWKEWEVVFLYATTLKLKSH